MQHQLRTYAQVVRSRPQANQASSSKGAQGLSKPYFYAKEVWNKVQAKKTFTYGGTQVKAFISRKARSQPSQSRNPSRGTQSFYNEPSRRKTMQFQVPRRPTFSCYYCGLEGHIKRDCRKRVNDIKSQRMQTNKSSNGKSVKRKNYF